MEENARLEIAEQAARVAASKITKINEKRKKHHHHHHNHGTTAVHQKLSLSKINSSSATTADISSNSGVAVIDGDSTAHIITKTAELTAEADLGDNNNKYRKRKHKRIRTNISHGVCQQETQLPATFITFK